MLKAEKAFLSAITLFMLQNRTFNTITLHMLY